MFDGIAEHGDRKTELPIVIYFAKFLIFSIVSF